MEKKFAELKALVAEIHDLKAALALLEWDQQVYLPAGAENGRAAQIETLSGVIHAKSTAAKLGRLIETLEPADYPEDSTERALLARLRRDFAKKNKVPAKLVSQLARTTAEAHAAWVRGAAGGGLYTVRSSSGADRGAETPLCGAFRAVGEHLRSAAGPIMNPA